MSSQPARTRAPRQPKPLPRPRAAVPPHEAEEQEQLPECFSRKISAEELRANLDAQVQQYEAGNLKLVPWEDVEAMMSKVISRLPS